MAVDSGPAKRAKKQLEGDVHMLAFDGGGSRGLMEVIVLDHIMNLASSMLHKPGEVLDFLKNGAAQGSVQNLETKFFETEFFKNYVKATPDEVVPIHPTEVFNYIIGTSTGSLIAFALVGGNKSESGRAPMSVAEIVTLYKNLIPDIFKNKEHIDKTNPSEVLIYGLNLVMRVFGFDIPTVPYVFDEVVKNVKTVFGKDTRTNNMITASGCIAGAVALECNKDTKKPDILQVFDSFSSPTQLVNEVLIASCNAPGYFLVPQKVGEKGYMDGGIGGNCPVDCAMKRIAGWKDTCQLKTILSIAPPRDDNPLAEIKENSSISSGQFAVLKYLVNHLTNGAAIFEDTSRHAPTNILLHRVEPMSKKSKGCGPTEKDVEKMTTAVQAELEQEGYFKTVKAAAAMVFCRKLKLKLDNHLDLIFKLAETFDHPEFFNHSCYLYNEVFKWQLRSGREFSERSADFLARNEESMGSSTINTDENYVLQQMVKTIDELMRLDTELGVLDTKVTVKMQDLDSRFGSTSIGSYLKSDWLEYKQLTADLKEVSKKMIEKFESVKKLMNECQLMLAVKDEPMQESTSIAHTHESDSEPFNDNDVFESDNHRTAVLSKNDLR